MFTVQRGKRVFCYFSFLRLCCISKLPETASFHALTNSSVWSYSPGPSSSFIFILTLGDVSFSSVVEPWTHIHMRTLAIERQKRTNLVRTWTLSDYSGKPRPSPTPTSPSPPPTILPPHWLVSIATAGGWGGRVSVYATCLKCWSPALLRVGGASEFTTGLSSSQLPLVTMVLTRFSGV